MAGKTGRVTTTVRGIALLAGLALLAACDEEGNFSLGGGSPDSDGGGIARSQSVSLVERDVEAPEVFQVTGSGLWDGRPSLGGVWVAHPDVTDPERVIIRNEANGKFVIGALFRRERDNPGPALQVSSDAANALEMLAGAPAPLSVTALRREEAPETVAPEAVADFGAPGDIAAMPLDPIANAAAAIDAAAATSPAPASLAPASLAPASLAPASPAPPAAASSLERPYIQLGIFSVEANANATAALMRTQNFSPRIVAQESQGRQFWRVIVGPAADAAARASLLDQVKAMGFNDAYFVRN